MFAEQLEKDNWNLLFFDAIRHLCKELKSKEIELDSITIVNVLNKVT